MNAKMSPEKRRKLLIQAFFRLCFMLGMIAGFFCISKIRQSGGIIKYYFPNDICRLRYFSF